MSDLMLRIDNVSKQYKLGQIGGTTLRDELQRWAAKRRGQEDPTKRIGAKEHAPGETFLALDSVSFDVARGERVGIIGHNGAGKSTLLKLISRVTAPTSGTIGLNGRVASMLEVGTGFHGELTGRENIYMNGAILGMTRREIDAKMEDIIEFSECRQFIDTPVKRYSSGMYVKLAFSVAAHLDSEIMIMDEVLAVGDMAFQKKCLEKMEDVSRTDGRTILYVSHNMNTIRQLCDRALVLDHGRVVFDGGSEEGIGLYCGEVDLEYPIRYDFRLVQRPSEQHGVSLVIQELMFRGANSARFARGGVIGFSLRFNALKDFDSLGVYFIVYAADGSTVGMTQSLEQIPSCRAGREYMYYFTFDCSNLSEGNYYFYPDIYTGWRDKHYSLDHPLKAVRFCIVDDEPVGLKWDARYYGHVMLNPLRLILE